MDYIKSIPPEKHFDYQKICVELSNLFEFFANKVDREFPFTEIPSAKELFSLFVIVAKNTYGSIIHLCAERPVDPYRKLEFSLSSMPLLRLILDEIFIVIYISNNLESKIEWYYKSGWREIKEEYGRLSLAYKDNPDWVDWFDRFKSLLGSWESKYSLTEEKAKDVRKIEYFPIPGRMKKKEDISQDTKTFLIYLEDRFYRDFSQTSHLSWSSLSWQSSALLGIGVSDEERENALKKIRSDCVFHGITLVLILFTEIELLLNFRYKEKLSYLWALIAEFWGHAKELYHMRYQKLLAI